MLVPQTHAADLSTIARIFALTGVLLLRYYGFAEAPQLPEAQLVELDVTEAHPDLLAFLNNRPYKELVLEAAVRYELHPRLIDAVIQTESAYDPLAVSHKGALGLMQLMCASSAASTRSGVSDSL